MVELTQNVFGFEAQSHAIPSKKSNISLQCAIANFLGYYDERDPKKPPSLLLLHYVGNGWVNDSVVNSQTRGGDLYIGA